MTVVFMEGFDHYNATQMVTYKNWATNQGWAMQTGRFGGQAWYNGQGSTNSHALPGSYTELIFGAAGKMVDHDAANAFALYSSGTVVVKVLPVASGPNYVWKIVNSAGTTLATGTTPIALSTWYYLELRVVVSATVGTVELRLNGSTTAECSATGVNTGALSINTVAASGNQFHYDDMYCVDPNSGSAPTNTWLGDVRVETLLPTSNGNSTAWTGVYTAVDEGGAANDDTDYIYSSTPGDKETYGLSDLSVTNGTVYAVQANLTARKDDAGSRTIAPVLRVGGTDYDGTTTGGLAASYLDYKQLYERLDPSGAAWTVSTVNAMEAGVKEVA